MIEIIPFYGIGVLFAILWMSFIFDSVTLGYKIGVHTEICVILTLLYPITFPVWLLYVLGKPIVSKVRETL